MSDTYYVEERSGVIGLGPLAHPQIYYRPRKTNWGASTSWIHLLICLLAIPLIIWNLYHLMETIIDYSTPRLIANVTGTTSVQSYAYVHPLAFCIVICAILMSLLGGVFALVSEAACFSEKLAKFIYIMAYLSIAISIYSLVFTRQLLGFIGLLLLLILIILFGFGFWRFTLISAIYLNEEGPVWYKPLLYGCLAAIPILTTGSQCRDARATYGCLSNDLFAGRVMYNDFFSFIIMTIIAILSAIPYLIGISHNEQV